MTIPLDHKQWKISRLVLLEKEYGWSVANLAYWGKKLKDEFGQEYCSGWDAYYLGLDGKVKWTAEYFATKELAEQRLNEYLRSVEVSDATDED